MFGGSWAEVLRPWTASLLGLGPLPGLLLLTTALLFLRLQSAFLDWIAGRNGPARGDGRVCTYEAEAIMLATSE